MTAVKTIAIGAAGVAALVGASAPAAAQIYPGYPAPGYGSPYQPVPPYGGYGYNGNEQMLVQQCTNAVQQRLRYNGYGSYGGYSPYGYNNRYGNNARVLGITSIDRRSGSTIRIRGEATSGMGYGPYGGYGNPYGGYGSPYGGGYGGYGGYGYQQGRPDLTFRCDVDYRGYVRDVDIDRRY
jgi:hypothetical protein